MISNTSTTSTNGVTLISGSGGFLCNSRFWLTAISVLHFVKQLASRPAERELNPSDTHTQVVEQEHRGDSHQQPQRRFRQGLGNAGHHRIDAAAALGADRLKRGDDTQHRPEQAHERRHRAHRRQHTHAAPQFGTRLLLPSLTLVARHFDWRQATLRLLDAAQVAVDHEAEQLGKRRIFVVPGGGSNLLDLPIGYVRGHLASKRA
jgi:hypothetical protein